MYLGFFKKYKLYVAIILALFAGFLLSLGFFFLFKKDETYVPVTSTPKTDENLVYFDVNSQNPPSIKQTQEIDDSELNVDGYNQEITDVLGQKPEVHLPVEEKPEITYIPAKPEKKYTTYTQKPYVQKHSVKKPIKTIKSDYYYAPVTTKYYPKKSIGRVVKAKSTPICNKKVKPCPTFYEFPLAPVAQKEIRAIKLEYANAYELTDFINKNIPSEKPVASAQGNSEIILSGYSQDVENAEKVTALLDTKPKVAVFKLNYTKPYKMAHMITNTIFNGGCTVCSEGEENTQKSPYAIYYNSNQNSITIVGASSKQMDSIQEFIQFTDIKSPQAILDILVVEFNDAGSRQFQKLSQVNINQDCVDYGISNQNIFNQAYCIIACGGGRILAKPRLTIANDSCYNINVTSDYVKCKQNRDVYNIEQDCGTKLKIYSCINPKGEVFLTLEPQYVSVKRVIPSERNPKATLFNRKSFRLENVKMRDKQTLFFGGVNSQQEFRKLGKSKIVNTELVMFVNVHLVD